MQSGDPLWTKPIKESNRALDPLAMNRVADRLLGDLLPGVTTISPRARYYSFHLWSTRDIADREDVETEAQFFEQMYRRERLFMLASVWHSEDSYAAGRDHTSIVGTSKGHQVRASGADPIPLDFRFVRRRSGGYGAAYVGPLQSLGLLETPVDGHHEQPVGGGEAIAEAFDEVARRTGFKSLVQADEITRKEVESLAPDLCLCRVADSDAPDRQPLRDVFLGKSPPPGLRQRTEARRETLLLILHVANLAERRGTPFRKSALLDACYFGELEGPNGTVAASLPDALRDAAARWKVFRAHDYLAYASEALLEAWLAYLDDQAAQGPTLAGFLDHALDPAVLTTLEHDLGRQDLDEGSAPLPRLITHVWPHGSSDDLSQGAPVEPVPMDHPTSERVLDQRLGEALKSGDLDEVYAAWPQLLIAVALRFSGLGGSAADAWRWMTSHTGSDLSPARFRKELKECLAEGFTVREFVEWFIRVYVIDHAMEVYRQKATATGLPRRWFHPEAGYWVKDRDWNAGHRTARFNSVVSILRDLALLDPDPAKDQVTADGRAVLQEYTGGTP